MVQEMGIGHKGEGQHSVPSHPPPGILWPWQLGGKRKWDSKEYNPEVGGHLC